MGLLSALYRFGLGCRGFYYNSLKRPGRLPAKVVSIGNITLGGTGKTPAVISVAREALKNRLKPCILTRGYKGTEKNISIVSDGKKILMNNIQAGDEAYLMADKLREVPVIKGSRRYEAGLFAIDHLSSPPTLFLLDDGFQHIALDRDIDIVLIDGSNPFGNGRVFPEGRLREPLSSLKRADIIIITKVDMAAADKIISIEKEIRTHAPGKPIFKARHEPSGLISLSGELKGLDLLKDRTIYAFSGIANPAYFKSMLGSLGAATQNFREFRDHHIYKQKDIDTIMNEAGDMMIITTEKDLVKLKSLKIPVEILALKIDFSIEEAFYKTLSSQLQPIIY